MAAATTEGITAPTGLLLNMPDEVLDGEANEVFPPHAGEQPSEGKGRLASAGGALPSHQQREAVRSGRGRARMKNRTETDTIFEGHVSEVVREIVIGDKYNFMSRGV